MLLLGALADLGFLAGDPGQSLAGKKASFVTWLKPAGVPPQQKRLLLGLLSLLATKRSSLQRETEQGTDMIFPSLPVRGPALEGQRCLVGFPESQVLRKHYNKASR